MGDNPEFTRRDALIATGGLVGGLAVGNAVVGSATAQGSCYRYDAVRVRLVDADARPPRFHTVERALYLTEPSLADCNADDPCGLDVLDYSVADDDDDGIGDDNDDTEDDDNGDDGDDDTDDWDDRGCPRFASVVLLCNAGSGSAAVVLTGLISDVLSEYDDRGFDFVAGITPSEATNVEDPEIVSSPCPTAGDDDDGDDDTGEDDDDSNDSDDGDDNDDDNGDDDGDDNGDGGDDDGGDDSGGDDDADDN